MKKQIRKIVSFVLAFLMVATTFLANVGTVVFASENTVSWQAVELSDITADDIVAITMSTADKTFVLPSAKNTKTVPAAIEATVENGVMTPVSGEAADYSWTVIKNEDGSVKFVNADGDYLYTNAANNGVRVGANQMAWKVDEASGYLCAVDSNSVTRYLGIYLTNPDWRAYNNTTGNTKNQKLQFYKLTSSQGQVTPACESVTASVNPGTVAYGTLVELSCATEGAEIYYNTNGSDNYSRYEGAIAVTDSMTIRAYAKADGYKQTDIFTFSYTVNLGTAVENVADGTQFVVVYENNGVPYILTLTASGKKLAALAASYDADGKLTVVRTEENGALVDAMALITAVADENGAFSLVADSKYLTSGATGNSLTFAEAASDYSLWNVIANEDGTFLIGNVNASYTKNEVVYPQYLEYYNGFTTYNFLPGTTSAKAYTMKLYAMPVVKTPEPVVEPETDPETEPETPVETEPETPAANVADQLTGDVRDGDKLVIFYANGTNVVLSTTVSGKKLAGVAGTVDGGKLTLPEGAAVFTVVMDENGNVSLVTEDGKYLTSGATGSALTLEAAANDYSLWTVKATEGGYYLINVNAKYGTSNQYLEYYSGYTTYSYKAASNAVYVFELYYLSRGTASIKVDTSVVMNVAQWAGNANYDEANTAKDFLIYGDRVTTNDMKDTLAVYTAVVNGAKVKPYTSATSTTTGSTSYYMGGTGLGSGSNDYVQLALSSKGFGNMKLSFRARVSNTGTAGLQLQYSTDGVNFTNFTTGTYAYGYTQYSSDGSSTNVSKSGEITDGIAKTSLAPTYYITFTFDVPAAAANADTLYIRMVADSTARAKGDGAPSTGGTLRVDSVVISGSPVIADDVCGYVKAEDGEVALDSLLNLTTSTAGATIYFSVNGGEYQVYDPANKPALNVLPAIVSAYAVKEGIANSIVTNFSFTQAQCAPIKATPNGGAIALGQRVTLKCATEGATILYAVVEDGSENYTWVEYTGSIAMNLLPMTIKVKAVKDGYTDSAVTTLSFTEKTNEKYNIYFGQIHAHTNFSDGAGDCEEAFAYASQVANLNFIAITDHSNSLDNNANSAIDKNVDTSAEDEWTKGHALAEKYTTDKFTAIYGYEMTWSNGLGHMNTFNTPGFQSRTQTEFATYSTALQNYYAALNKVPDSISQFNHPGTTFGDFSDFAYFTEANDALITMIEVGNGEGAIGSSGYFPSYEYYTRALDKGWHVAPTNNQDNHKGKWGDANTARTVVLADANNMEAIYDAMRNYRIYATEDNNLSIYYTLDSYIMGTILEQDAVGETATITVELSDADATDKIGKVEVIVNGGLSIASTYVSTNAENVTFVVPTSYSYYYIKVTEADGDIAVTAPVWVGDVEACGINKTYTNSALAVAGENLDIHADFFNNEKSDLTIDSIQVALTDNEGNTVEIYNKTGAEAGVTSVASKGTATFSMEYLHKFAGTVTYEITVHATLDGVAKTYSDKLSVSYATPAMVTNVIIDGTHFNDYVNGYYSGSITSFISICAEKNIRATVVTDSITADMLKDCALLVLSAPAKKSDANIGYKPSHYSEDFLAMVGEYVKNGGSVIVCGIADYQDTTSGQTATEQNKLLDAIGATIRMNSDEAYDDVHFSNQNYRLYPENFNLASKYLAGVVSGQTYSQYSGCTVDVSGAIENEYVYAGESLVMGFDTTYSIDCKDENGNSAGNVPFDNKGNVTFVAHQSTKFGGNIFVAGGVFMSNYEVSAEKDNNDSLPYVNYTLICNILDEVTVKLPISSIADARDGEMGEVFAVEGYVTSGTDNENTTFFDTIYIQDATGGIDIFPYATAGLAIGTKVRVIGYVAEYQGDRELKVISAEILSEPAYVWDPQVVDTQTAMDYDKLGGSLLNTSGVVTRVEYTSDGLGVAEFWIKDASGVEAAIFIDGYIYSATTGKNELASFVKVGNTVSATGILYMHPEGDSDVSVPVFRVRNCDEIVLVAEAVEEEELPFEEINGKLYYVVDGKIVKGAGLIQVNNKYYYIMWDGSVVRDSMSYKIEKTNGYDVVAGYHFIDENGVVSTATELKEINGKTYAYVNGVIQKGVGIVEIDGKLYYAMWDGQIVKNNMSYKVEKNNGYDVELGYHYIDEDGVVSTATELKEINGVVYLYINGVIMKGAGLVRVNGNFYYVMWNGAIVRNNARYKVDKATHASVADADIKLGYYGFREDGTMILPEE